MIPSETKTVVRRFLWRAVSTLGISTAVVISLLVFPSAIPSIHPTARGCRLLAGYVEKALLRLNPRLRR